LEYEWLFLLNRIKGSIHIAQQAHSYESNAKLRYFDFVLIY